MRSRGRIEPKLKIPTEISLVYCSVFLLVCAGSV